MEIKTTMQGSDYKGNRYSPWDCIGHRAFKRACKKSLPWYKRIFMFYTWMDYSSDDYKWQSFKNERRVNMMSHTKVGDKITFKKLR